VYEPRLAHRYQTPTHRHMGTQRGRRTAATRPQRIAIGHRHVCAAACSLPNRRSIACLAARSGSSRTLVHPRRLIHVRGTLGALLREHALAHLGAHLGAPTSRNILDRRCAALKLAFVRSRRVSSTSFDMACTLAVGQWPQTAKRVRAPVHYPGSSPSHTLRVQAERRRPGSC